MRDGLIRTGARGLIRREEEAGGLIGQEAGGPIGQEAGELLCSSQPAVQRIQTRTDVRTYRTVEHDTSTGEGVRGIDGKEEEEEEKEVNEKK